LVDKVIFNCFFCRGAKEPILQALGLSFADLFAESSRPLRATGRRRRIAEYHYEDINGELLSTKCRYEPKSFRWQSPAPSGSGAVRWKKSDGVTLYRLPQLVDASHVLVVEGEKSVDRLFSIGFTATCPPSGAGAWPKAFSEALWRAGSQVAVVIGDNDRPGDQHAGRVVRALHRFRPTSFGLLGGTEEPWASWPVAVSSDPEVQPLQAKLLRLSDLPYHGDVCDWLDRGHTADELRDLIQAAPDPDEIAQAKKHRERELARHRQRRCRARKGQAVA
jgi:hypothetical protein